MASPAKKKKTVPKKCCSLMDSESGLDLNKLEKVDEKMEVESASCSKNNNSKLYSASVTEELKEFGITHLDGPLVNDVEIIFNKFYETTARFFEKIKENSFGPHQFHNWPTIFKIKEKSPTLHDVAKYGSTANSRETMDDILKELQLSYKIVRMKTCQPVSVVAYDINCDGVNHFKISFLGKGETDEEALDDAANRALVSLVEWMKK